jgi:hypothetical protein
MESIQITSDIARHKKRARAIQQRFKELGVEIKLGHALEALALALGFANWATLSGTSEKEPVKSSDESNSAAEILRSRTRQIFKEKFKTSQLHEILNSVREAADEELLKTERPISPVVSQLGLNTDFNSYWIDGANDELKRTLGPVFREIVFHELAEMLHRSLPSMPDQALLRAYRFLSVNGRNQNALHFLENAKAFLGLIGYYRGPQKCDLDAMIHQYEREFPGLARKITFEIYSSAYNLTQNRLEPGEEIDGLRYDDIRTLFMLKTIFECDYDRFNSIVLPIIHLLIKEFLG